MAMLTHPHTKPAGTTVKDATHVLSDLRPVKDAQQLERTCAAAQVADAGVKSAIAEVRAGATESQVAVATRTACATRAHGACSTREWLRA
jgi:Xaa-Pro aminopeptidase